MPTVTLLDATKFDADSDTLSGARPELKNLADGYNTIGTDYNNGVLGGKILPETTTVEFDDNETIYNHTPTSRAMAYFVRGTARAAELNIQLESMEVNSMIMLYVRNEMTSNNVLVYYNIGPDAIGSVTVPPNNKAEIRNYIFFDTGLNDSAGGRSIAVYSENFTSSNLYTNIS